MSSSSPTDQLSNEFRGTIRRLIGQLRRHTMLEWVVVEINTRDEAGLETASVAPFHGGERCHEVPLPFWHHAVTLAEQAELGCVVVDADEPFVRLLHTSCMS